MTSSWKLSNCLTLSYSHTSNTWHIIPFLKMIWTFENKFISVNFESKYNVFYWKKMRMSAKWQPHWSGLNVLTLLVMAVDDLVMQGTRTSAAPCWIDPSKWSSFSTRRGGEWFSSTAFLRTADIEVHIVHTSRVIIAYNYVACMDYMDLDVRCSQKGR